MAGIGDGHNGGGPIWAIFDADAVERENWDPEPPNVDIDGGFFFSANTLAELAAKIVMKYQRVPMPPQNLEETVGRYNSFVDIGRRRRLRQAEAALQDRQAAVLRGLVDAGACTTRAPGCGSTAHCQVVDMNGEVIPGLYCGGESVGRLQPAWPGPLHLPGPDRRQASRGRGRAGLIVAMIGVAGSGIRPASFFCAPDITPAAPAGGARTA